MSIYNNVTSKNFTKIIVILTCALISFSLHAQNDIFEADFDNSLNDFDDDGRVYTSSAGVTLRGSYYRNGNVVSPQINTEGMTGIELSYTRNTARLSAGEYFTASASSSGSRYTVLESVQNADGRVTFKLPAEFDNKFGIRIRFAIVGSSYFDSATVSDLVVSSGNGGGCVGDECCEPNCGGDGSFPPVNSVFTDGPFDVSILKSAGPGRGWVAYPTELGKDGLIHPIFIWGPGAGADQSDYEFLLRRLASHGFVVYSEASTGDGDEMIDAFDWLVRENNRSSSRFYRKLDAWKVALGGHSRGSIGTFEVANHTHVLATVHVAGGSFDGDGPSGLRRPAIYIGGTEDFATPNIERDYNNTTVGVFFTVMDGVDHVSAAREGLPAITAWLRWHLGFEHFRKEEDFLSRSCTFCTGKWESQAKNW